MVRVLTREESTLLRFCVNGVIQLAEEELSSCTWVEGGRQGVGRLVPQGPLRDERIVAIVRDHLPAGAADWEIAWWAPDCLCDTIDAARRVAVTLSESESGAAVVLKTTREIDAWCRLIGDVLAALDPYREGEAVEEGNANSTEVWLEALLGPLLVNFMAI